MSVSRRNRCCPAKSPLRHRPRTINPIPQKGLSKIVDLSVHNLLKSVHELCSALLLLVQKRINTHGTPAGI